MRTKKQMIASTLIVVLCLFFVTALVRNAQQKTENVMTLHNGWSIAINEAAPKEQPTKDLSDYSFSGLKMGDVIYLERSLDGIPFEKARLILDTWHVAVTVLLDGEEIYSQGQDYIKSNRISPSLAVLLAPLH